MHLLNKHTMVKILISQIDYILMIEIYKFEDDLLNTEILKALNFGGFYCKKIGHEYVQLQMLKPTSYLHKFFFS